MRKEQNPIIANLMSEDGTWKDRQRIATERWADGVLDMLGTGLSHLTTDGESIAEPKVIEIWLGIDLPLGSIDFRLVAITDRGIWIDDGVRRLGDVAVFLPWTTVFCLRVHSDASLKVAR